MFVFGTMFTHKKSITCVSNKPKGLFLQRPARKLDFDKKLHIFFSIFDSLPSDDSRVLAGGLAQVTNDLNKPYPNEGSATVLILVDCNSGKLKVRPSISESPACFYDTPRSFMVRSIRHVLHSYTSYKTKGTQMPVLCITSGAVERKNTTSIACTDFGNIFTRQSPSIFIEINIFSVLMAHDD